MEKCQWRFMENSWRKIEHVCPSEQKMFKGQYADNFSLRYHISQQRNVECDGSKRGWWKVFKKIGCLTYQIQKGWGWISNIHSVW